MNKIITTLLAICLLVSLLAVPASAAAPDGWTGWFSGFTWPEWFYNAPEQTEPEPEDPEAAQEYTIRYDANGGYWWSQYASPAISNSKTYTVDAGESHTIISAPIRTGYTFQGWEAQDGAVYQPGEKITPTENMTLKALWG